MTNPLPRRGFILTLAATGAALATHARAQALVDEKDAQAVALGYVADAKRVDFKKYPKYAAGQICANCALYQGKPTDIAAGCPLFAGKQVAGAGWCTARVKKRDHAGFPRGNVHDAARYFLSGHKATLPASPARPAV